MGNLGSAVDELLAVDVRGLADAALVEEISEIHRAVNRLQAAYHARLEVIDRRGGVAAEHGSTAAWLREVLRLSPVAASQDVHLSRDLVDVLPCVAAGMADGAISVAHARVLAGLRKDLTDECVRAADPHLADGARSRDAKQLREFVTAVRHSYAPQAVVRAEREAYQDRELHAASTIYGTGVGHWSADPVSQETIMTAIHAASKPLPGDDRTPAQRRFDGLLTVCEIAMRCGQLPDSGGVRPHVTVLVPHHSLHHPTPTAAAPADHAAAAADPADTAAAAAGGVADLGAAGVARLGFGAVISGTAARRVACDGEISRIITGPHSEILDAGRATRSFTAAQRRAIVARDQHCRWPGCDRPPGWCDAHHQIHWADGGPTSVDNAILLCGRHHDRVHHDNHQIISRPDGSRTIDIRPGTGNHPTQPRHHNNTHPRAGP